MTTTTRRLTLLAITCALVGGCAASQSTKSSSTTATTTTSSSHATDSAPRDNHAATPPASSTGANQMQLGNFSVSLAVKDIAASRGFYEKLGFQVVGGDQKKNWLVLQNDTAIIGLFQGMFDKNMLTFNPGWDRNRATPPQFDDVRDIQVALKKQGLSLTTEADESTTGPAFLMLTDPDGNPILVDQHVPRPAKK